MSAEPDTRQRLLSRLGVHVFNEAIAATLDLAPGDALDSVILLSLPVIMRRTPGGEEGVSMSLVARELSLSYETVRRRVADMRAEGRCEGKRGVVRPVTASGHRDRRFFDRLAACAVGASRDAAELGLWRGEPLEDLRDGAREAAVAQIQDHTLSMIKSLRRSHGLSVIDVVLISGVHRINLAREFAERGRLENLRNAPALATRKPASMFQIAKTLSLPYETVRRRLIGLREKGLVDRDEAQGFVARTRLEENPGVGRGLIANAERTEHLLRALNALCLEPVGLGEPA